MRPEHRSDDVPPVPTRRTLPPSPSRPTAWRRVRTPRWAAIGTRRMVIGLLVLAGVLALAPWQQFVVGSGNVFAFLPEDRERRIEAPIDGRTEQWFVQEGQRIAKGDPIVQLTDNDPELLERLDRQIALTQAQLDAAQAKVAAGEAKVTAAEGAREAAVAAAEAKIRSQADKRDAAEQEVTGAEASFRIADSQRTRAEALAADGLRSTQSVEDYRLKAETTEAKLAEARAKLRAAIADLDTARSDRDKAVQEADGKVAAAEGDRQAALAEAGTYEQKLVDLQVKRSRQQVQLVTSPMDAFVVRVVGGLGGEQVKKGAPLALLVPDTQDRAVELTIDGNDVALVRPGEQVRLQFEGWPALQFAGWPSVAWGTFGGRVAFIDAVDDGSGSFRVVVRPDPDTEPWPEAQWLRQGVKAKGWVLLSQVPLGYELWRQLNDFPPTVPKPEEKKDDIDPIEKGKAGKAWRPK